MDRRQALAVMGGMVVAGKLPANLAESDPAPLPPLCVVPTVDKHPAWSSLLVTCRCDNDWQTKTITFNKNDPDPLEVHRAIEKVSWWPDGNTQGVYVTCGKVGGDVDASVEYRWLHGFDSIVCPSLYCDNGKWCEFEFRLNERYTLRMNRHYMCIDDAVNKYIRVGSSVGYPTGVNGRQWRGGKEFMFGRTVKYNPSSGEQYCCYTPRNG